MLALWIGPAIRRLAAAHDLRTVGDYLELRYSASVRGIIAVLLWVGSLAILAGQLIAIASILTVVGRHAQVGRLPDRRARHHHLLHPPAGS